MAHQPMDDFKRNFIHRDPWDPTGWGVLPHEPTTGDRHSNNWWDEYKYDNQYWEDYVRTNDYGEEVQDRRLRNPTERSFYDDRQKWTDEYDTALHWQNTRLRKPYYEYQKKRIERDGLQNVVLTPQITGHLISLSGFPTPVHTPIKCKGITGKTRYRGRFSYIPIIP